MDADSVRYFDICDLAVFSIFFFPKCRCLLWDQEVWYRMKRLEFFTVFFSQSFSVLVIFLGGKFCRFLLDQETLDICEFSKGIVDNIILIPVGFWRLDLAKNTRRIHMFDRALKRN